MALAAFGYSALVCSTFSRAQKRVIEMGFPDNTNTHLMMSGGRENSNIPRLLVICLINFTGIWLSAFALGFFVGPTVAGLTVNVIGFRSTTIIFFALFATMAMATLDAIKVIRHAVR